MTSEVSPVRKALAALILVVALFAAVVVQLTVVNRLPLPDAAAPDLVLLLVAAIAVSTGPVAGAVTGFAGGLALDVAPPTVHYAGEYALIFCLVGYAAARVVRVIWNTTGERDPIITFTVMAAAAVAGEAGKAALGMLLSDPDVTRPAITGLLPTAILYDLLLAPFVYWLVAFVARGVVTWGPAGEHAPVPDFGGAGRLAPVFRQASAGAAPRLRLAGTGGSYASPAPVRRVPKLRLAGTGDSHTSPAPVRRVPRLRLAGTGDSHTSPSLVRRVPKLRLSAGHAGSSFAASAASLPSAPVSLAGGRTPKLNFAADRPRRGAARSAVRTPGKNWLRSARSPAIPAAKRAVRAPSRGWLNSAGSGGLAGGRTSRRPRGLARTGPVFAGRGRSALSGGVARPDRSPEEALAARSAPSGLSALAGAGTPLANRRSPQAGWLRSARATPTGYRQRRTPRSGWLGGASRPRTVIGSDVRGSRGGAFRRSRGPRGNWYAASPSGAWLRRGRHPWRRRSKRLLQLVGVGVSR